MRPGLLNGEVRSVLLWLPGFIVMKRCLIVDDSDVVRKVASAILSAIGYEVIEASNGREGFDLAKAIMPDAILLDWQIPELAAHDFIAKLRSQTSGPRPYLVYLTTEFDHADITRALGAGADGCLMKPFDRASLEDKFRLSRLAA
jgi:two-component system, chemotaxis family, chemotaxis protein CheY